SDPLEIFTDRDGGIILKKYSPIGELSEHAQELCASLYQIFSLPALISDKDQIVAAAGFGKRDLAGLPISEEVAASILRRGRIQQLQAGEAPIPLLAGGDPANACACLVCVPIISQSDAIGAVLLLSQKPDAPIDPAAARTCEVVASFLGRQME
ncbi:MAG: stage V sporulation T C-terminal domain-containing protein, partial [Clostridia bacterium]|nr:stage V sporulation T C-terminal domain-containing protein [Clostridia bacterium]